MKKTLIIFALILIGHLSSAQSVEFYTGYLLPNKKYSESVPSPKNGHKIGVQLLFNINSSVKLKTGIEYNSAKYTGKYSSFDILGNKIGIESFESVLNYIGIPIGLRYEFKGEKVSPFIDSDIKSSFLVKSTHKNIPVINSNKLIVNASIGGGFKVNTTKKSYITASSAYNFQINNTYKSYSGVKFDGVSFNVSFGIKLK